MGRSNAPDVRAKDEDGDAGRLLVKFGEIGMNAHEADQPPNGSRLSCGASADGRKRPALRYELVGAQTYASSESRPRQLQALVRPQAEAQSSDNHLGWDHNLEGRRLFRWWTA